MAANNKIKKNSRWSNLDSKIEEGLKITSQRLIAEEKKKNGYLVIADKNGKVKKIPAKDL